MMIIDDEDNMVCMFILVVATVYQPSPISWFKAITIYYCSQVNGAVCGSDDLDQGGSCPYSQRQINKLFLGTWVQWLRSLSMQGMQVQSLIGDLKIPHSEG